MSDSGKKNPPHDVHEETPLPIALYADSGWCTDFAIRSLDQRGVAYRVAFSSDTSGGLKLAVVAGLAVAPISRSNIPADCRELMPADGFAEIDASRVVLHRNPRASSEAIAGMAEAIPRRSGQDQHKHPSGPRGKACDRCRPLRACRAMKFESAIAIWP